MAQEIRVELTCDNCKAQGIVNTDAESMPPVAMGKGQHRIIDLCEPCRKEVYDPLADLLGRDGRFEDGTRRRTKKPKAPAPEPAPVPGPTRTEITSHICPTCSRSDFKTDASMRQHSTRVHGIKLEPAEEQGETLDNMCPDCGSGPYKNVGTHRFRAHGVRAADPAHIP